MTNFLQDLFRPSLVTDDGEPVPFVWIGDDDQIVCMNPNSTKVYATMCNDGYGKFYTVIYVSLFAAVWLRFHEREPVVNFGLRSFPRCALSLIRFKCRSMTHAKECLEELLVDLHVI